MRARRSDPAGPTSAASAASTPVAERERQSEAGARAGNVLDLHAAAVGLDDADRQAEAEPRAFADALGREERIEDAMEMLGRDARPVVFHLDHHPVRALA